MHELTHLIPSTTYAGLLSRVSPKQGGHIQAEPGADQTPTAQLREGGSGRGGLCTYQFARQMQALVIYCIILYNCFPGPRFPSL